MKKLYRLQEIFFTKRLLVAVILLISGVSAFSQVPPNINSGNPNFPFPQFLDYQNSKTTYQNLARVNSPGVTHAEMELRAREAYQILLNRATYATWGGYPDGTRYIRFLSTCDCTEGDGYALLATAVMGDKITFDGMYGYVRDRRRNNVTRWSDGGFNNRGKQYGTLFGVYGADGPGGSALDDAATDGDIDIAMALMIAWKQWGDNMGRNDFNGNPISYRNELISILNTFVERAQGDNIGDTEWLTGIVGYDGYLKSGNTFNDLTPYGFTLPPGDRPQSIGPTLNYVDYHAPSYFKQWYEFLKVHAPNTWNVNQHLRASHSSDWLMGNLYSKSALTIPHAGLVSYVSYTNFTFGDAGPIGEDPRHPWRNFLNEVWHGSPDSTWNPTTLQVVPGGNTFQRDMAIRYATYLKRNQQAPWNVSCEQMGTSPLTYFGIPVYGTQYKTDGTTAVGDFFKLNWNMGAGAPAAVIAQDFKLMGEMFRQCEIEFDVDVIGDRYLTSRAVYFHEWFRLLGMLILSGNYHAPSKMVPSANMKIYMSVDKTFAYPGDLVTYTFSYRNYGKLSSTLTQINNLIPIQYEFVSATGGGTNGGASVLWNLGTIPGFNGTNLSATQGSVTVTYRVKENATGRVCNTATISTQGVVNWTNNEYPNNVTELMERNCVDITQRPLYIQKSSNREFVNPGQEVEYTLDFGNASIPFLNGGRPGVVLAFANTGTAPATQFGIKLRLYHGAEESYINYKNYRISYFISDASTNWSTPISIYEGGLPTGVTVTQQNLNPGTDANGAWNQRLIFQFADQLCTTTPHLGRYYGLPQRIHRGGAEPLRAVWRMHLPSYAMVNWADDWSAEPTLTDADDGLYYPITNDWTDPNNPNIPINRLHPNACDISTKTTSKILVEEWDGYTWRRVFGNGPVSGREVQNVVVEDVLPNCVTWNGFVTDNTLGVTATYNPTTRTVRWTIPVMRINDVGRLKYKVVVNDASCFGGCPINNYLLINEASIEATNESKLITKDTVIVTCNPLPPVVPPSDLIKRVTSSGPYSDGSTVTYELEYTNVNGSIADPNLSTSADWTRQSGSTNFNFASNQMTTVNSPTVVMTYGYSHGTNGTMTGTINVVSSATIGIAFRHIGGGINNGLYVTLKPNFGAGNVEVRFWNGTTPLSTATYGITAGPVNYKIVLNGGTASLWLNNFNGTPLAIQTGLPIRAGYAGILNGDPLGNDSYASHQITDFYTNLDSAFGLQFYDPVPSGLTYVSSSNSGVLNAGVVQWPVVNNTTATPLLAGQTLRRTWTATISTCNGDIYNIGYLKIRGITPDLAALATINCNTSLPLDWLYFSALPVNGLHELTWATANEREVKDFIIQVSTDGKIFEDVQSFPAQNRSLNQYKQSIIPRSGVVHYYRIKEVSIDASVSYSSIQVINTNDFTVQLFPTPFEYETIVAVYTTPEMTYTIQVFDASGKLVQGGLQYSGSKEIKLGSSFAVGSYIIEITNSNKVIHQKIIKY